MGSHFLAMVIFAACVAVVFSVLMKDKPLEQLRLCGLLFTGFVGTAVVLGWLLFPFPL
jgi:energy-converting hydrogenase Eha subunit C